MSKPFVSIVTPTYNRKKFIQALIKIYTNQTYPKDKMEWIILDDGDEPVRDLFIEASKLIPNIRYTYMNEKETIGFKRNWLNKQSKGDIIISMDDDDFYFPERVEYTVKMFNRHPSIELAGCSEVYMYYTDNKTIYRIGPYESRGHATNGTLAIRSSYAKSHKYNEYLLNGEESQFLDNFQNPLIRLDSLKVMLVISHSANTFNKIAFRETPNDKVKKTSMKLKDFIKDKNTRDFFSIPSL